MSNQKVKRTKNDRSPASAVGGRDHCPVHSAPKKLTFDFDTPILGIKFKTENGTKI